MTWLAPSLDPLADKDICDALVTLRSQFFPSLNGTDALVAFDKSWTSFNEMVVARGDQLQEQTISMIYSFVQTLNAVIPPLIEVTTAGDELHQDFLHEVLRSLSIEDDIPTSVRSSPSHSQEYGLQREGRGTAVLSPPYIEAAYIWLLHNLHDPYPSKDTKVVLARQSGANFKDIDNWFINVRKRIGWNRLRIKHFSNKRNLIVAAATQAFRNLPRSVELGPDTTDKSDFSKDFLAIEERAKELYADKHSQTPLPMKLDGAVTNLSPDIGTKAQAILKRKPQQQVTRSAERTSKGVAATPRSYPQCSPDRSPGSSSMSLSAVLGEAPRAGGNKKRRHSDSGSTESDVEVRDGARKRCRLNSSQSPDDLEISGLPSPTPSAPAISQETIVTPLEFEAPSTLAVSLPTLPVLPGKRKRGSSDAGDQDFSKRPHYSTVDARVQIVSNPLALVDPVIAEWFDGHFADGKEVSGSIPSPASAELLDETSPVEVDFYDYGFSPYVPDTPLRSVSPPNHDSSFTLASGAVVENIISTDPSYHLPLMFFDGVSDLDISQICTSDLISPLFSETYSSSMGLDHSTSSYAQEYQNHTTMPPIFDPLNFPPVSPPNWSSFWNPTFANDLGAIATPESRPLAPSNFNYLVQSSFGELKSAKLKRLQALEAQLDFLRAEISVS
ncbi:C-terminal domain of homeodomain 1-domain-containing protein [Crassisporium funariophilum]|nr:C-terminal domain of homeodomain 1-domain-containing protein [Crassisporium funariophilum]